MQDHVRQRPRTDMRGGTLRLARTLAGVLPSHQTAFKSGRGEWSYSGATVFTDTVLFSLPCEFFPFLDMSDVEQFGKLRLEVQFGGGTGQLDIHLHRTKRAAGILFFFVFLFSCFPTLYDCLIAFTVNLSCTGVEPLRFPHAVRVAGAADHVPAAGGVGDPQVPGDDQMGDQQEPVEDQRQRGVPSHHDETEKRHQPGENRAQRSHQRECVSVTESVAGTAARTRAQRTSYLCTTYEYKHTVDKCR